MALITSTVLNSLLDLSCGYYLDLVGTSGNLYAYGTQGGGWGANAKAAAISTAVIASGDLQLINQLSSQAINLQNYATGQIKAAADLSPLLFGIQYNVLSNIPNASVRNLDTYLTYLNTGNSASYWAALQNPAWLPLATAWSGAVNPSPWNIYVADPGSGLGSPYSTGYLGQLVVSGSVFTAGDTIDNTKYAGGFPAIVVTGLTGTGTVTVTGSWRNPAAFNSPVASATMTAAITTNGTFTLSGGTAPASSLLLSVSAISVSGGISAGTIQAITQAPSGRPSEP